jgi:general secretion pathway protein E
LKLVHEFVGLSREGAKLEELSVGLILQRVLNDALDQECSDVHIFTVEDELVVQFRVGGSLAEVLRLPEVGRTVLRRIKALAKMDVAESRIPQDGSFFWLSETHESAVRVASLPTVSGEAMVLRLLPKKRTELDLCTLGLTPPQARQLTNLLQSRSGLLLVAGPTSSGKTTTLYAMMEQLVRLGRRVISIEDPVEQVLADCHQMQVRERMGITFDVGLRAALRQDPDVIMVGEIRDESTAKAALRASLTGHLVLSTTHARDLVGAAMRLVDLGLERHLLGEILTGVVIQTLQVTPVERMLPAENVTPAAVMDKIGVFNLYVMTPEVALLLASDLSWPAVRKQLSQLATVGHYEVS